MTSTDRSNSRSTSPSARRWWPLVATLALGAWGCGKDEGLVVVEVRAEPDVLPAERVLLQAGNEKGIWATAEFVGDLPRGSEPLKIGIYVPEGLSGTVIANVSALDAKRCEVGRGAATGMLPKAGTMRVEVLVRKTVTCGPPPDAGAPSGDVRPAADGTAVEMGVGVDGAASDAPRADAAADTRDGAADVGDALDGPPLPPPLDGQAGADLMVAPPDAADDGLVASDVSTSVDVAIPVPDAAAPVDAVAPDVAAVPDAAVVPDAAEDAPEIDAPVDMMPPPSPDMAVPDVEVDAPEEDAEPDAEEDAPDDAPTPTPDAEPDAPPDAPVVTPDMAAPDTAPTACNEVAQSGCGVGLMCVFNCNPPPTYGGTTCIAAGTLPIGSDCTTTSQCAPGGHCIAVIGNRRRCFKYCRTSADCPTSTTTGLCQYRLYCTGEPAGSQNTYLCGLN